MKKKTLLLLCVLVFMCIIFSACANTKTVSLSLIANDGSEATVQTYKQNEAVTLQTPTRDGYAFEGWYTAADFSGSPVTEITLNADTTVYAKWEKLYTLSLNVAGGSISTTSFQIKAGTNIKATVADLVPTKTDCRFGMWLLNNEALSDSDVMPAADTVLIAKYQAKYTVEIYKQNTALNGYEKDADVMTGYAYIGEKFTSEPTIPGFNKVTTADSVNTLTISEDASKNVYRHYFNRASFTVTFDPNFPDGSQTQVKTEKFTYGIETKLPTVTYEMPGYYLEGWSLTPNGEIAYYSHIMDSQLFNAEPRATESFDITENTTLYAVWSKGYTDLFGGKDIIYVSVGEEKTAYLYRGDRYFRGELDNKELFFYDKNNDILFQGMLTSDGKTFLYLEQSRSELVSTLYEAGSNKGLNENVTIYFDAANGITYSVKGENGVTSDSKGEYFFDENGNLVATFSTGELSGKTLHLIIGSITLNNVATPAFQVRNDLEFNLGTIVCFVVQDNEIVVLTDNDGNIVGDFVLNGFGSASYNNGAATFPYTYNDETKILTITDSRGTHTFRLLELNGKLGYMEYNASKDVSYTLEDGSVLTLDGMNGATYTNGNTTAKGFYSEQTSAFGGTILTFTENNTVYKFMITTKTEDVMIDSENPDAGMEHKTVTVVERKDAGYAEYYYKNEAGTYYAPLLVFDTADRSTATVWGYTASKTFLKMATASLTFDAATQTYTMTVNERFEAPGVFDTPINFATIKSCVLMLNETATSYCINFWLSYTDEEQTTDNAVVYTGENGETLTLTAGLAISKVDGQIEVGTYSVSGNVVTLSFAEHTDYVTLDDEAKTFAYTTLPTTIYEVAKDGTILQKQYLTISSGNITYTIITEDENGESVVNTYPGTLRNLSRTSLTGFPIYQFVSDEKKDGTEEPLYDFAFINISSNRNYFFTYDPEYEGTYNSPDGVLRLDGFGYVATYGINHEIIGMYQKNGNDVRITTSDAAYYFVLNGVECVRRGDEYGKTYLLMDNQVFRGCYVTLDGLGGASVFRTESVDGESQIIYIDENATYTLVENDITLVYKDQNETHTFQCKLGTHTIGSTVYNALNVKHEEVVTSYVNEEDWSVLVLNSDGTAQKYMKDGKVENGTFSLVTDSLLYYVNSASTDAYIYVYDREKGTATPQNYDACAYYTKDLESLLFTKYGFAIFNNETRYYYTIDNGNITLYHLDAENSAASEYGYVAEDFGKFTDTKLYHDKTYYKNDGFAISFVRNPETASKYPVVTTIDQTTGERHYAALEALTFTPTGAQEFSVNGVVTLDGKTYNCVVVRTVDEEGVPSMYIRVSYFYFDITVSYQGDASINETSSTYEVTALTYRNPMYSYTYLNTYYYIYSMLGANFASQFPNSYGNIQMVCEYDEEGHEVVNYLNGVFGTSANFIDANGNRIERLEHAELTTIGNNVYLVTFTGDDGYDYALYLQTTYMNQFQTYAYRVYALVRNETVDANDGYQVSVGRVIASEAGAATGSYFNFSLSKDGEAVEYSSVMLYNGKLYYIIREVDEDGKLTGKTTYYELELTEKNSGVVGDEGENQVNALPVYESAKVTLIEVTTYLSADGADFIDVFADNSVILMSVGQKSVIIVEYTYDEATSTYTLKSNTDETYTVTIKDNVATFVLVPAEDQNS